MSQKQTTDHTMPSAGESRRGWHRISTCMSCPRKYCYRYRCKLTPVNVGEALALGSLLHEATQYHYLARRVGGSPAGMKLLDPVEAMRLAPARVAWVFEKAKQLYLRWSEWAASHDRGTVLDVEREFEARLGGELFTARLDGVLQIDDEVLVDERKTTSGDLRYHYREWEMRGQTALAELLGRHVLAPTYGLRWGGILLSGISTRLSGEMVGSRHKLLIPEGWPESVANSAAVTSRQMATWDRELGDDPWGWPVNPTSCLGKWGWCDYKPLCERGPTALREYIQAVDRQTDRAEDGGR